MSFSQPVSVAGPVNDSEHQTTTLSLWDGHTLTKLHAFKQGLVGYAMYLTPKWHRPGIDPIPSHRCDRSRRCHQRVRRTPPGDARRDRDREPQSPQCHAPGAHHGHSFVPRIGDEVLIDYAATSLAPAAAAGSTRVVVLRVTKPQRSGCWIGPCTECGNPTPHRQATCRGNSSRSAMRHGWLGDSGVVGVERTWHGRC